MMRVAAAAAFALLLSAAAPAPDVLFDGRTLAGWRAELVASNGATTDADRLFAVEEGAIHVYSGLPDGTAQPTAVLVTRRQYRDYRLHLEYRWGEARFLPRKFPARDAGVLLHVGADRPGLVPVWYRWPKSLEFQIMEGATGDAYALKSRMTATVDASKAWSATGGPYVARLIGHDLTSYKVARGAGAVERPGWNDLDVVVRGASAEFLLNGVLVNRVTNLVEDRPGAPVKMDHGAIALQAEGAEVFYRAISLEPLR